MPGILKPEHIVELIAVTAGLTGIVMILKKQLEVVWGSISLKQCFCCIRLLLVCDFGLLFL